jgi:hypothetical protein
MATSTDLVFDAQFPNRLYSEFKEGATRDQLAERYGLSRFSIDRRLELAHLLRPTENAAGSNIGEKLIRKQSDVALYDAL